MMQVLLEMRDVVFIGSMLVPAIATFIATVRCNAKLTAELGIIKEILFTKLGYHDLRSDGADRRHNRHKGSSYPGSIYRPHKGGRR